MAMLSATLVEAVRLFGDVIGWDLTLLLLSVYQLFWPDKLHPTGSTRLKRLMMRPNPGVVAALEAVYKQHDELSRRLLLEHLNGDEPHAWEFELTAEEIDDRRPGD